MLSSIANTLSQKTGFTKQTKQASKSVSVVVPDEKDQEVIVPDRSDNAHKQNDRSSEMKKNGNNEIIEMNSFLSVRAQQVKTSLLATNGVIVNAVLITKDGKTKQIKYNTSSSLKQVNEIIGGRPTIIGELEQLNAIVVTSITASASSSSSSSSSSSLVLPYPLCKAGAMNGDILIYRCDESANACNLSIDEYSKYCETNKDLTSEFIKNNNNNSEERPIKPKSLVPNESGYTLQTLSVELARQYTGDANDVDAYVTSKIESIINESLIDDSPLNDPDYDVEDDRSQDPDYNPNNEIDQKQRELDLKDDEIIIITPSLNDLQTRIESIYSSKNEIREIIKTLEIAGYDEEDGDDLDESVWRKPLNDSLNFVRAKARSDKAKLIEKVNQFFYDCNGEYPNETDLIDIFNEIQSKLAQEARNDENDNDDDNDDDDDDNEWRAPLDEALNYVRAKGRFDGKQLAQRLSERYDVSTKDLALIFKAVQQDLGVDNDDDNDDDDDVDDDGTAYNFAVVNDIDDISGADPVDLVEYSFRILSENMIGQVLSAFETTKRREPTLDELRNSLGKMTDDLTEKIVNSYEISSINLNDNDDDSDDVDDDNDADSDYNPDNAKDQNQRRLDEIDEEERDDNDDDNDRVDDDDVDVVVDDGMLQSEVRYSKLNGNGESYSVYFGELPSLEKQSEMLELAVESFEMRNGRSPNFKEMQRLKETVIIPNRESIQMMDNSYSRRDEDDEKSSELLVIRGKGIHKKQNKKNNNKQTKLLVTPVKTKKNKSARYDILLDQESTLGSAKKEQTAIEWFERFNNRKPSKEEIENIKRFVETDSNNLKLELFDVVDDDDDNDDDDLVSRRRRRRRNDNNNNIVRAMAVKRNKATKYTLDFKEEQQNDSGDIDAACKWFVRFNGRKPTKNELRNIYAFTKNDVHYADISDDDCDEKKDDTIDID